MPSIPKTSIYLSASSTSILSFLLSSISRLPLDRNSVASVWGRNSIEPSSTLFTSRGIRWVGARRLTSVAAYDFTSVPVAVLSVMALGITRPAETICIATSNPLHTGTGHDCDQGPSSRGRRRPWSRRSSNEEPLVHRISHALGLLVFVSLVLVLISSSQTRGNSPPPLPLSFFRLQPSVPPPSQICPTLIGVYPTRRPKIF